MIRHSFEIKQKNIAKLYCVSEGIISKVKLRQTWKHVPWPTDEEVEKFKKSKEYKKLLERMKDNG